MKIRIIFCFFSALGRTLIQSCGAFHASGVVHCKMHEELVVVVLARAKTWQNITFLGILMVFP